MNPAFLQLIACSMPILDQHAHFFMYFQNSFKTAMEGYHFLEYSFIGEDDAAKHETSSSD